MQLSKLVSPKNEIGQYVNLFLIISGIVLFVNFFAWSIASKNFDLGYKTAEEELITQSKEIIPGFEEHQTITSYYLLADEYLYLGYLTAGFLVLCFAKKLTYTSFICWLPHLLNIVMLTIIYLNLRWVLGLKDPSMNESLHSPYNRLLMTGSTYDWFSFNLVMILIVIEVVGLFLAIVNVKNLLNKQTAMGV